MQREKKGQGLSFKDRPTILIVGNFDNVRKRKYRKKANKIKGTRK
jgi:hypothetical protein